MKAVSRKAVYRNNMVKKEKLPNPHFVNIAREIPTLKKIDMPKIILFFQYLHRLTNIIKIPIKD